MRQFARNALDAFKQLQQSAEESTQPPLEGSKPRTARVIDLALVADTRGYLEKVAVQINGTYEHGWYDACAVMLRRFIETLIIEAYIAKNRADAIKKTDGDFYSLKRLIDEACSGRDLDLSRDTRDILRKLKKLGDRSAHNRRFIARRTYFDELFEDLHLDMQTVVQDFIEEADFNSLSKGRTNT